MFGDLGKRPDLDVVGVGDGASQRFIVVLGAIIVIAIIVFVIIIIISSTFICESNFFSLKIIIF